MLWPVYHIEGNVGKYHYRHKRFEHLLRLAAHSEHRGLPKYLRQYRKKIRFSWPWGRTPRSLSPLEFIMEFLGYNIYTSLSEYESSIKHKTHGPKTYYDFLVKQSGLSRSLILDIIKCCDNNIGLTRRQKRIRKRIINIIKYENKTNRIRHAR